MLIQEQAPLKPEVNQKKKKTLGERYQELKDNITVEPVLACFVVPGVLSRLATQNLNLDKACRVNMNYSDKVCDALINKDGAYQEEELAIQQLIAGMEAWKNVLLTAIPSFLILFIGAWSDRTRKRKVCILLPIFGDFLMCLSNIVNVYYFYELRVEVTMFFEALFPAITGGWITTYMGVFSYISDVSSEETRTFRIGVTNLCLTAGGPIGSALSGILLKHIGYYGVFATSCILYLFSIVYGYYCVKDPEKPATEKEENPIGIWGWLRAFFNLKHVKDTFEVTFKKGPNRRRTKSILIFVSIVLIYGCAMGDSTVRYLFTRYRFNWDALKYSFYSTFYIIMHALGALISISLFSRHWHWDDSVLGIISCVSKLAGGLATGLAANSFQMYLAVVIETHTYLFFLAVVIETFNATSFTAMRSIISKLVSSDELGKMISLFNLMEVVTSMVFGPIYSCIYQMTVQWDAGFVYYVSTVLIVPPILIFVWFYRQHKKCLRKSKTEEETTGEELETKRKGEDILSSIDLADEKIFLPID